MGLLMNGSNVHSIVTERIAGKYFNIPIDNDTNPWYIVYKVTLSLLNQRLWEGSLHFRRVVERQTK